MVRPQQTDWTEPWLLGLVVFHALCLLLTWVSSRRYELQVGHFLCIGEWNAELRDTPVRVLSMERVPGAQPFCLRLYS